MVTRIGQLAQEVSAGNPWWRGSGWETRDRDLTEVEASGLDYHTGVLDHLTSGGLYILRGPRRVGKTVAVKQLVSHLISEGIPATAIVRVAVDGWAAKDLRTLTQNVALPASPLAGGARYWLIDEITAVKGDWATQLKWLRDNDAGFAASTVVLTGSSATGLTEAAGVLAGRRGRAGHLDRTLLPMGFRTFTHLVLPLAPEVDPLPPAGLRGGIAAARYRELLPWLDDLVRTWERYIETGGYPVAVSAAVAGRPVPDGFVADLFDIVAHDAFRTSQLGAPRELALLERLWTTITSFAQVAAIGDDLGISRDVVARHMNYLENAYLLWHCPQRDERGWVARERAQSKVYAVDPLIARLPHLRSAERRDIDPTALTEMQLGNAIRRRLLTEPDSTATPVDRFLFHVRTPTRKEIDFVSEGLGEVAVEGKYTEGAWKAEAATVNASAWAGILATRNVFDIPADEDDPARAWAVPAGLLAYLLDT